MILDEPNIWTQVYQQFTFFYDKDVPNSLIALKKPANINCLFQRRQFVWLIEQQQPIHPSKYVNLLNKHTEGSKWVSSNKKQPTFIDNLIKLLNMREDSMISKMTTAQLKTYIVKQGNKEQAYDAVNDPKGQNYFKYKKPVQQNKKKYTIFSNVAKSNDTLWNFGRFSCVQQIVFYSIRNLEMSYKILKEAIQKQGKFIDHNIMQVQDLKYELTELNDDYSGLQGEQLYFKLFPSSTSCQLAYTSDIVSLIRSRRADSYFEKITPNFVSLVRQVDNSNYVKRMIQALIRQSPDIHRETVIKQFVKLVKHICPQSQTNKIDDFMLDYQVNGYKRMKASKILAMYTDESFFHKFINKMLRSSKDPLQIFYLAPVFMDLFDAIKQLYQIQKQKTSQQSQGLTYLRQFTCFRGAYFNEQQLENFISIKDDYIESLGFLSTTISKQNAISMATNTLMIIHVHDVERDSKTDYGYAFIEQFSHYGEQKEILFNPLNSFKIQEIMKPSEYKYASQTKQLYTIVATYGRLSEIIYKKQSLSQNGHNNMSQVQTLTQVEQNMYAVAVQQKNNSIFTQHQGHILRYNITGAECALYYSQRRLELQKQASPNSLSKYKQSQAYLQIGKLYLDMGEHYESIEYCRKADQILSDQYGKNSYQRIVILDIIAFNYAKINLYKKSLQIFSTIKQIFSSNPHEQDIIHKVTLIINEAHILLKLQKQRQSMKVLQQAQKLYRKKFKQFNNTELYARLINQIANGHQQYSNFRQALNCHSQVLQFRAVINGQYDKAYIQCLENIALTNLRLQRCEQSYQNFKQCLRLRAKINKRHHRDYLSTLFKMGHVLQNLSRYEQALTYYQQCKKLQQERQEKSNNIGYADAVRSIAGVYALMGLHGKNLSFSQIQFLNQEQFCQQYIDKCISLHKQCIQIYMRVLASEPLQLAKRLFQIPKLYPWFNMKPAAIFMYQNCLRIFEKNKDQCWIIYSECLNNLGKLYIQENKFQQGKQCILQNLNVIMKKLGTNNLQYAQTLLHVALMYRTINNNLAAIQYNNQVYNVVKNCINGPNTSPNQLVGHELAIQALRQMAQIYNQIGIKMNPLASRSQQNYYHYLNHSIILYNLCIKSQLKRATDTKSESLSGFTIPNTYNKISKFSYERDLVFKNLVKYQSVQAQFVQRRMTEIYDRNLARLGYLDIFQ